MSADFWLCLRKFSGQADRGRLAGQQREFKFHRKSAAQAKRDILGLISAFRPHGFAIFSDLTCKQNESKMLYLTYRHKFIKLLQIRNFPFALMLCEAK